MKPCLTCHGSGKGQPIATGFESAWRINAWAMQQPCHTCKGKGVVSNAVRKRQEKEAERRRQESHG